MYFNGASNYIETKNYLFVDTDFEFLHLLFLRAVTYFSIVSSFRFGSDRNCIVIA